MTCYRLTRHLLLTLPSSFQYRSMSAKKVLCMFDIDGTLTASRQNITEEMRKFLVNDVASRSTISLVGGSDYKKIAEQINSEEAIKQFHSVYSENGLVVHQDGKQVSKQCIQDHVGEEKLQRFINFALRYMSELTLPVKRGTFIEFRNGLVNVCPVGRSCSQAERDQFDAYDKQHNIRKNFVEALKKQFPDLGLCYVIGGQISIDVYPDGWDKTYSLRHIPEGEYDEIHFFGDKTDPGGNDHELYKHPRVIGHNVTGPDDTRKQLIGVLKLQNFD